MTGSAPFEPCGPLPWGRLAIEASAGTGKTYALADLATRFVAEGQVTAAELLIVTFTRAAANELRSTVRRRLDVVARELADDSSPPGDDVVGYLAAHDCEGRSRRLRQAVMDFDAATVATIHGFATQVRSALGTALAGEQATRILPDTSDLVEATCIDVLAGAAVDDLYSSALPTLKELRDAVRRIDDCSDLVLFPSPSDPSPPLEVAVLVELVQNATRLARARRRAAATLSFNDVLTEFQDLLHDQASSASAVQYLRGRYRVVLIDEFQDTDPVQWDIFSILFGERQERTSLVLVGDPKQSIYGFRGADVHTYLRAVADERAPVQTLGTNWRSDGALIECLDRLLTGATFGEGISFLPVVPSKVNDDRRLEGAGGPLPAMAVRLAVGGEIERTKNDAKLVMTDSATEVILDDLVAQVRELLEHAWIPDSSGLPDKRRVRPQHIAVLVPRNAEAEAVQSALMANGIPAVVSKSGSVLHSEAATQLRWVLHALDQPSDPGRVRLYALTWFGGWDAERLAAASDGEAADELDRMQEQLRGWAERLSTDPVAAVLGRIRTETDLLARVLADPEGDRHVTDLDHLTELLCMAAPGGRSGAAGLLATLDRRQDAEADGDPEVDEDATARRLETDAEAVQVMTVWRAKGLQFPIVCLPLLWHEIQSAAKEFYDPEAGRRVLDLADDDTYPDDETGQRRANRVLAERQGERLRTLYVALTRAQHHNVVWWARTKNSECSALARVLFARIGAAIDPEHFRGDRIAVPDDGAVLAALQPVVVEVDGRVPGALAVEVVRPVPPTPRWRADNIEEPAPGLAIAQAPRPDRRAQRWSFSAVTRQIEVDALELPDPLEASEEALSDSGAADEGAPAAAATSDDALPQLPMEGRAPDDESSDGDLAVRAPNALTQLPAGTAFGTLVHSVLERARWPSDDPEAAMGEAVDSCLDRFHFDLSPLASDPPVADGRGALVAGLLTALRTPLGSLCGDRPLIDFDRTDRLGEVTFDFHLAEADRASTVHAIGEVVAAGLAPEDPFAEWARSLSSGTTDVLLAGHLTGSIDLLLRVAVKDGDHRFVVCDYKTNALHEPGRPASAADYTGPRMADAMVEHDYPLQALVYSVALHRYLRWRLPGYRADRHLGGSAYLFLRGMDGGGSTDGTPHGVFEWAIPPSVVVDLSDLLAGFGPGSAA